jgi:hypothetical protein
MFVSVKPLPPCLAFWLERYYLKSFGLEGKYDARKTPHTVAISGS